MKETLPQACQEMIRAYFRLDFGEGREVACPYFQNTLKRKRFGTTAEVGKGTPKEIVAETSARAQVRGRGLSGASGNELRSFMTREGIGVDCSGFVARVMDPYVREKSGKPLGRALRSRARTRWKRVLFSVRPFHNTDVMTLTDEKNCASVSLSELRPGDLIRTRGGKHVLLVSQTERNEQGALSAFTYVHSSEAFGDESGVREGTIVIRAPDDTLEAQDWQEVWQERTPAREGWLEKRENNGIFRLKSIM